MKENTVFARNIFGCALLILLATTLIIPAYSLMFPINDWRLPLIILYGIALIVLLAIPLIMHQKIEYHIPGKLLAIFLLAFLLSYPIISHVVYNYVFLQAQGSVVEDAQFGSPFSWAVSFPHGAILVIIAYNYAIRRKR